MEVVVAQIAGIDLTVRAMNAYDDWHSPQCPETRIERLIEAVIVSGIVDAAANVVGEAIEGELPTVVFCRAHRKEIERRRIAPDGRIDTARLDLLDSGSVARPDISHDVNGSAVRDRLCERHHRTAPIARLDVVDEDLDL